MYVHTLASLRNRLAPAADTQGWGRAREHDSKDTRYVCCCNAFKIVLASSMVDRRSSPLTRQGGHVLQHRQPGASLRFVESIQRSDHRTAAKRPLSLREEGHHAGGAETPHWGFASRTVSVQESRIRLVSGVVSGYIRYASGVRATSSTADTKEVHGAPAAAVMHGTFLVRIQVCLHTLGRPTGGSTAAPRR